MGYSASLLSTSPDEPVILLSDRLPDVLNALHTAESVIGSHISWCDPIASYTGTTAEIIARILSDYGWQCTEPIGTDERFLDVQLGYWGGDKLGSCWDQILHAIAQGIDPALTITFFMSGEDGDLWAERLHAGQVETLQVRLEVVQP